MMSSQLSTLRNRRSSHSGATAFVSLRHQTRCLYYPHYAFSELSQFSSHRNIKIQSHDSSFTLRGIMGYSMNIFTIYFSENKYEQTIESIDNLIVCVFIVMFNLFIVINYFILKFS